MWKDVSHVCAFTSTSYKYFLKIVKKHITNKKYEIVERKDKQLESRQRFNFSSAFIFSSLNSIVDQNWHFDFETKALTQSTSGVLN